MFHIMLIVMPLIFFVIVFSILLFGIVSILAGILGGAAAAALIKNKIVKPLLLITFCIFLFIGTLCILPLIGLFTGFAADIIRTASVMILFIAGLFSIAGIVISTSLSKKIGKIISIIFFSIAASFFLPLAVFIAVIT